MSTTPSPLAIGSRLLDINLQTMVRMSSIQTSALMRMADATTALARATLSNPDCATLRQARSGYGTALADTVKAYFEDSARISAEQLSRVWSLLGGEPVASVAAPAISKQEAPAATPPPIESRTASSTKVVSAEASSAKASSAKASSAKAPSAKPSSAGTASIGKAAATRSKRRKPASPRKRAAAPEFRVVEDDQGAHFQLVAADGEAVLTSRSYPDRRSAHQGISVIMKNARQAQRYERRTSDNGDRFFEIRAGNNRVLWRSGPYEQPAELEKDIDRLISTVTQTQAPPP